jgi:tRNA modification GTPase
MESLIDQVLVLWMPGPRSYTGEDVVELSCHGNPVIQEQILDRLVELGARLARPGEFTRRALLNGRMDLLQAEAVSATIEAGSVEGIRLAMSGMDGGLSRHLQEFRKELLECCAELEARLDHPGQDLGLDSDRALAGRIRELEEQALTLSESWRAGRLRLSGARVALVGVVNAGKSSLFNSLVGSRRALVSEVAGTTRDVVESSVVVDGLEITWMDTAGRRDAESSPVEALESAGIALGMDLIEDVDLEIWVHRMDQPLDLNTLPETRQERLIVGTHADLDTSQQRAEEGLDLQVSNLNGQGIEELKTEVRRRLDGTVSGQRMALYSQRQHDLIRRLSEHAGASRTALTGLAGVAVAAEELQSALHRLAELSGGDPREEVLDRLFSRFCIGK